MSDVSVIDSTSAPIEVAIEESGSSEQFLRLQLVAGTTVLLPVHQLAEVLTIETHQIVPIPHLPSWVMGIYNWRGEILWMLDVGHLGGLTPWYQQSHTSIHSVAVLQMAEDAKPKTLGLVVSKIEEIEWCDPNQIQPFTAVTSKLASLIQGYWCKPNGEALAVLDGAAVIAAMPA
ncbi:CheW domain-containing protein [Microcoleus sp. FACHB-1515]|nr:CheW domain-containing protein [Microcoleus sp. FACHB-1515]